MATTLTHAMILMALVDFLALKYLQANKKFKALLLGAATGPVTIQKVFHPAFFGRLSS
jgi:hypothetical protein